MTQSPNNDGTISTHPLGGSGRAAPPTRREAVLGHRSPRAPRLSRARTAAGGPGRARAGGAALLGEHVGEVVEQRLLHLSACIFHQKPAEAIRELSEASGSFTCQHAYFIRNRSEAIRELSEVSGSFTSGHKMHACTGLCAAGRGCGMREVVGRGSCAPPGLPRTRCRAQVSS